MVDSKPSSTWGWALVSGTQLVDPVDGKRNVGFVVDEEIPSQYINSKWNNDYQWKAWLDTIAIPSSASKLVYINSDGTFSTSAETTESGIAGDWTIDGDLDVTGNLTVDGYLSIGGAFYHGDRTRSINIGDPNHGDHQHLPLEYMVFPDLHTPNVAYFHPLQVEDGMRLKSTDLYYRQDATAAMDFELVYVDSSVLPFAETSLGSTTTSLGGSAAVATISGVNHTVTVGNRYYIKVSNTTGADLQADFQYTAATFTFDRPGP